MKIVITGSLGNISKPLTIELIQKGHEVIVISNKTERKTAIESLGAKASIGSLEDVDFLSKTFSGADVVYLMEPPINFFDHNANTDEFWESIANSYAQAIQKAGITKVIHLSSIGGHTDQGNGMLRVHHYAENILKQLPNEVSIKCMRPVGFYYNMFAFLQSIKTQEAIIQNYGGDKKEPWVSPLDIANVIAEEIEKPFDGRTIRYIASDEVSPNEVASILGNAIGKPNLKWIVVPDEAFLNALVNAGMNPHIAKGLVDMNIGRRNSLYVDYYQNQPKLGKIKLKDFTRDFAKVYK